MSATSIIAPGHADAREAGILWLAAHEPAAGVARLALDHHRRQQAALLDCAVRALPRRCRAPHSGLRHRRPLRRGRSRPWQGRPHLCLPDRPPVRLAAAQPGDGVGHALTLLPRRSRPRAVVAGPAGTPVRRPHRRQRDADRDHGRGPGGTLRECPDRIGRSPLAGRLWGSNRLWVRDGIARGRHYDRSFSASRPAPYTPSRPDYRGCRRRRLRHRPAGRRHSPLRQHLRGHVQRPRCADLRHAQ